MVLKLVFSIFFISFEATTVEINWKKADSKALSKTFFLLKSKLKSSEISISFILNWLACVFEINIILRGLRAVSDFEYEFQLAGMNRQLDKKIETVFLMSDPDNQVISSKFVKEIAKLNGKIDNFVTKSTKKSLKEKYD